ncbi:hypothetical protein GGI04_002362 [Coemansia thaxteri]|nr:hypothetical protein GGI04_002362 [Coemansia thaxteri]KAJ2471396.1 hypothetical protein GGI02_002295 [Coemansia sp. RSA 2322]
MTADQQGAPSGMSGTCTRIAVVGTSGFAGLFLKALRQCSYFVNVRAVTRAPGPTDKKKLGRMKELRSLGIEVVEYTEATADGFAKAFADIDTVVSAVSVLGVLGQIPMIDGSILAGVKWFIPSEFGVAHYTSALLPCRGPLESKSQVLDYLMQTAQPKGLAYTAVYTGLAIDYIDPHVIGLKLARRSATLVGRGGTPATFTCTADVVRVVVSIVQRPSEMQNRVIRFAGSTAKMSDLIKLVTGRSCGENVKMVCIDEARSKFCELARLQNGKAFHVYCRLLIEEGLARINLQQEPLNNDLFPEISPEPVADTMLRLIKLAESGSEMLRGAQVIRRSDTTTSVTDGVGKMSKSRAKPSS